MKALGWLLISGLVGMLLAHEPAREAYDRNWPQWRGPRATGVAPYGKPPLTWGEELNIRWKVAVAGKGHASPIIWGDLVFVCTAIETDRPETPAKVEEEEPAEEGRRRRRGIQPEKIHQFALLAIDRKDGSLRWQRIGREELPHEGTHPDATWASNSPVTDGETVYAYYGSRGLYAYDFKGTLKWEKDLGDMTTRHAFGEGSSPVVHGDKLIINWDHEGDSFITALNKDTGETHWKVDRKQEVTSWSTPIVVTHDGKAQVIVNATHRVRGYDLETGAELWEAGGMTVNTIPSPVAEAGMVYVTSGFRGNALLAIKLAEARGDISDSPAIVWRHDADTPYVPSPLLHGDYLYFLKHNRGILSCFDAKSGKAHYGPERLEGVENVYASPVAAGERVYFPGRNGATLVLKRGPQMEVLAKNVLEDGFDASPAIVGNELYMRGRRFLYCIAEN